MPPACGRAGTRCRGPIPMGRPTKAPSPLPSRVRGTSCAGRLAVVPIKGRAANGPHQPRNRRVDHGATGVYTAITRYDIAVVCHGTIGLLTSAGLQVPRHGDYGDALLAAQ